MTGSTCRACRSSCTRRRRARPRSSGPRSSGSARSCTSTTRAARAPASAPSAPTSGWPTRARSGKSLLGPVHIVDADGTELGPDEVGQVWFESAMTFEYHGDPEKTASAFDAHGWSSLGDMGRVDDEGYLYLTDRVTNMIISGGVNIYPREIEDVLVLPPERGRRRGGGRPRPGDGRVGPRRRPARRSGHGPGTRRHRCARAGADRVLPRAALAVQVPAVGRVRRRAARGCPRASWPSGCCPRACSRPDRLSAGPSARTCSCS